jgi:hypothetical protein
MKITTTIKEDAPERAHRHPKFGTCTVDAVHIHAPVHKKKGTLAVWEEHAVHSKPGTVPNNYRGLFDIFPNFQQIHNCLWRCFVCTNNLQ